MGTTSSAPFAPNGLSPGVDRSAERALRAEVREAVGRLLGERQALAPSPEDEARIAALIDERVEAYQRRAVATNAPLLADPEGLKRRLFDGLCSEPIRAPPPVATPTAVPARTAPAPSACGPGQVDINTASSEALQQIAHIGPARAAELIQRRPYGSVDQLGRIDGIGPARIRDIKEQGVACVG